MLDQTFIGGGGGGGGGGGERGSGFEEIDEERGEEDGDDALSTVAAISFPANLQWSEELESKFSFIPTPFSPPFLPIHQDSNPTPAAGIAPPHITVLQIQSWSSSVSASSSVSVEEPAEEHLKKI